MAFTSKECPNCPCREWEKTDYDRNKERFTAKKCINCWHKEPYTPKKSRPERGTTKSQHDVLRKIFRFFFQYKEDKMSDVHYEHRHTDWGPMEVKLELKGTNVFLEETYAFHISRRGKITVIMASGMGLPDDHDEHIANMVDGHTMD